MKRKNTDHTIDLRSWLFKFRTRWYLFLAFTLIALAGAYVFVKSSTRIYAFKSTLLLGDQHTGSKKAQELLNLLDVQNKGIKVEDEIGLLTSADMVRTTLKRLDFSVSYYKVTNHWLNTMFDLVKEEQYDNAPFVVKLDTSSLQLVDVPLEVRVLNDKQYELTVKAEHTVLYDFKEHSIKQPVSGIEYTKVLEFGKPFKDKYLSLTIERANPDDKIDAKKHYFVLNSMDSQVGQYMSSLHVAPIDRDARILEVSTKGTIPVKEMLFLNTLMDTYVSRDLEEKNTNGQKTLEFIDSQIASLTDSLRQSKQALSTFRSSNRIANLDVQSNISYEKLSQLEMERSKLSTEKQYYVTVLDQIEDDQSFTQAVSPAVAGVQNPNLANLFGELSRLNQQRASYSVSATQDNPRIQVIDSEIKSTRNAIVANIKNLIRSTDISIANINSRIGQLETSIAKVPENERRMMDLQSQADFVSKKYDFLLEKRAEAAIALATNTTDKKIVDKASQWGAGPQNVKPNMIFMLALILGLIIPAALIVLLDNVDNTIQGKNDLNNVTNIPFLGVIAHGTKTDKLAVKNNPRSAIAESFRSIRINLQYLMSEKPFQVIGVTSSVSGEGKTFTSVNLSSEIAMSGKRTILIESDMRKPTFGKYFNTHNAAGLSSYLGQGLPLEEVIQKTDIENLDIISCGPIPENAIKLLEQKRMVELIVKLKEQYDYIVIDTPPIGFVAEYFVLMKHMDTNIYVVKHKYTSKDMLEQVNELYATKKLKNIHMVINDLDYNNTYEYGYKKKGSYYYV
jgi:capsular exopolysaccharide synthesis family protein